jgi:peptidoglycan/xylan/chitin deacetylase (PgdA/CDA1 family)
LNTGKTMTPSQRSAYSAIVDRPLLKGPDGAKVIVWTIVNLEVWDISRPMPRTAMPAPSGQTMLPDVANWAWHEYGMRVGVWRYFKLFERLGIRPTLSINARVCEDYERVAAQARDSGWEFMAHGYDQIPMHKLEDQRSTIHRAMDVIERFTGKRSVGWLGPGLTQTLETPDLLAEAGIRYIGDWVYDDEPTTIHTTHGPLVTLPYNFETHDIATMILQHHESPYWVQKCRDTLDRYLEEGEERTKIMAIALHPYIMGQPHRIRYLEEVYEDIARRDGVVHMNGAEILDWYVGGRP